MTGAKVFLAVETPRKRTVWETEEFMKDYLDGGIKSVANQELLKPESSTSSAEESDQSH